MSKESIVPFTKRTIQKKEYPFCKVLRNYISSRGEKVTMFKATYNGKLNIGKNNKRNESFLLK